MRLFTCLKFSLLFTVPCMGEIALQTDWSEGPGIQGPVECFNNAFYQTTGISWDEIPGEIR